MSFYVRTHKGSTLSQWSLGNGIPVTSRGGDYFVFYSHGLQASAWQFWIEVQVGISWAPREHGTTWAFRALAPEN